VANKGIVGLTDIGAPASICLDADARSQLSEI
jgi:hypothetical protein